MDRSGARSRLATARQPLSDASSRDNVDKQTPPRTAKPHSVMSPRGSHRIPHHESIASPDQGPALRVRDPLGGPGNKRVSAVAEEETDSKRDSKRSSQASTSTNASLGTKRKTHIGPWHLGADVGKGMSGQVRKVRHSITGETAAAKIISKSAAEKIRSESMAHLTRASKKKVSGSSEDFSLPFGIEREIVIMKLIQHPHVVQLFDIWENRRQLYLIMEYVEGGELFDYIKNAPDGCLEEDETVWIFRQIVAAILHCHRIGIFHRDIKPENILISIPRDPETGHENPQVKVVDFGMAALQPKGKRLKTPCGTPHYAAPELYEREYDGAKVDVWSLGVILYAMLTGSVPFDVQENNRGSMMAWYRLAKSGNFFIPEDLSYEARDLICRMLTPDPRSRIALREVWDHPLINKWTTTWKESEEDYDLNTWIGPRPMIADWKALSREDIDEELIGNLHSLWHSEKEETLIQRILSKEVNYEKYFYLALLKHQEEQLENYVGPPDTFGYSASDYHHCHGPPKPSELPPIPPSAYSRTNSQFSIQNDELVNSKNNLKRAQASVSSYDPFRSSRDPIINEKESNFNVVIHRHQSNHSRRPSTARSSVRNSTIRNPGSLRVEALRKEQDRRSVTSSPNSPRQASKSPKSSVAAGRNASRSSMSSSSHRRSPAISTNKSRPLLAKRPVNFSHVRRSSTMSALTPQQTGQSSQKSSATSSKRSPSSIFKKTPPTKLRKLHAAESPNSITIDVPSSPPEDVVPSVVSRKEATATHSARHSRLRKSLTASQIVESESRKCSTELEKFCEEAFYRSSAGSTITKSITQSNGIYETPPSSISNNESRQSGQNPALSSHPVDNLCSRRSLPETPNTFLARELAETRKKLAERYSRDNSMANAYHEVLSHLDQLVQDKEANSEARRVTSAPEPRQSTSSGKPLPIISEEAKPPVTPDNTASGRRPMGAAAYKDVRPPRFKGPAPDSTIRQIDPESASFIRPLNIRKASSASAEQTHDTHAGRIRNDGGARFYQSSALQGKNIKKPETPPRSIETIDEEDSPTAQRNTTDAQPKKVPWFRRFAGHTETKAAPGQDGRRAFSDPSTKGIAPATGVKSFRRRDNDATLGQDYGNPPSPKVMVPGKRAGFLSLFNRKRAKKADGGAMRVGATDAESIDSDEDAASKVTKNTSISRKGTFYQQQKYGSSLTHGEEQQIDARDIGVQRNWLARFLKIKPASRIVCFGIARGRARQEIVRLLRSWQRFGMRDVLYDRERNLISARLAPSNYLGIKEVAFYIELFVVLEYGRRAHLCLARVTQRKGAASSFRQIVDNIENRMRDRGLLVENQRRKNEMQAILQG